MFFIRRLFLFYFSLIFHIVKYFCINFIIDQKLPSAFLSVLNKRSFIFSIILRFDFIVAMFYNVVEINS